MHTTRFWNNHDYTWSRSRSKDWNAKQFKSPEARESKGTIKGHNSFPLEFQQFDETIFAIPNINIVKQKVDRYKVQYLSLLSPWKSGLLFITAYVIITSYMEWPNWLHIACLWRVYVLGMYKSYIKVITFKQNKFYFFFSVLLFTVSDYSFGMFNLSL